MSSLKVMYSIMPAPISSSNMPTAMPMIMSMFSLPSPTMSVLVLLERKWLSVPCYSNSSGSGIRLARSRFSSSRMRVRRYLFSDSSMVTLMLGGLSFIGLAVPSQLPK